MSKPTLAQALREDFLSFAMKAMHDRLGPSFRPNWSMAILCDQLEEALSRGGARLIINMPPRTLKSTIASVALPAYALGRDPRCKIICVSYSQDLANLSSRDTQQMMSAGWYENAFGQVLGGKRTETYFETRAGGSRLATSVGGTLTGKGADLIIVDDPLKANEAMSRASRRRVNEFYDKTLISRLNNPAKGSIILVAQRLHTEDLAGYLLARGGWTHICLPAIAPEDQMLRWTGGKHFWKCGELLHPEHLPQSFLDEVRSGSPSTYQAQYLQEPIPTGGAVVKARWLKRSHPPHISPSSIIVQSWDTAVKAGKDNDFSVCTTWQVEGADRYLIEVHRERLEYPDLRKKAAELRRRHQASTVLVEDQGLGSALISDLKRDATSGVIGIRPDRDKQTRLHRVTPLFEAGNVFLPESAPWLAEYELELLSFPQVKHDDQVDSTSQFLNWSLERERRSMFEVDWGYGPPELPFLHYYR